MRYGLLLVFALAIAAFPARAATECYAPEEERAEQILRLHSELMVIAVTCRYGSGGEDLVKAYTGFTHNNIKMLHNAEAMMTQHFKKTHGGKGIDQLDRLRTLLANEYGQEIANKSAPVFCAQKRDKVVNLYYDSPLSLSGEILRVSGKSYEPSCTPAVRTARKSR